MGMGMGAGMVKMVTVLGIADPWLLKEMDVDNEEVRRVWALQPLRDDAVELKGRKC